MDQITIFNTDNFKLTACDDREHMTYVLTFKDCMHSLLIAEQDIPFFEGTMKSIAAEHGGNVTVDDVLGHTWCVYVPVTVEEKGHGQGR